MRLSRFAAKVSQPDTRVRVGFAEAFYFDLRPPEDEDDAVIAEQRVASLHHVPLLLGTAHLLGALAVLFHDAIYVAGRSDNEAESAALAVL